MHRLRAVLAVLDDPFPASGWGCRVCEAVVASLEWIQGCAITVHTDRDDLELFGFSHAWVRELHDTAYGLGEGPGFDAYTTAGPVIADRSRARALWPWFTPAAAALGVGQMAAFPLRVGTLVYGSVSAYSRLDEPIPCEVRQRLEWMAVRAGGCVARRITDDPDGGVSAVSYPEVHTACGMIAAEARIRLDEALARLRAHAFATGRALPTLAAEVVARHVGIEVFGLH